jgi:predicted CopG family antitoxin
MESTTVKVSKDTAKKLAVLQRRLQKESLDETIRALVAKHRSELLEEAFGADGGRIGPFKEADRGEDRR